MHHKISPYQMGAWMITAFTGPIAFFSDGNWLCTLMFGGILSFLSYLAVHYGRHWKGKPYAVAQLLWITVLLSQLVPYSAKCWPTGENVFPLIPLSLLFLAGYAALNGVKVVVNGMNVLFWCVALLLCAVIISGAGDIKGDWLSPQYQFPQETMLLVFLLPALPGLLGIDAKKVYAALPVLAAGISAWIAGSVSPVLSEQLDWPFYQAAKSAQFLDVAKRFEALVSVGVTIGNFALYAMFFCAAYQMGENFGRGRDAVLLSGTLASLLMLFEVTLPMGVLIVGSFVFWIWLPLLSPEKISQRRLENNENSP